MPLLLPGAVRDPKLSPSFGRNGLVGGAPLCSRWACRRREGLTETVPTPPPRSYLSLPAPHLGAGPLFALLGTARCTPWGLADAGEGRSGRALRGRGRGRGPSLRRELG